MKWIVDIKGEIDGDYELICKYEERPKGERKKGRKVGKWIKMSDADGIYYACNECGEDIPRIAHYDPQFDLFPRLKSIDKTRYCPNCGADMRGDSDDETGSD